MLIIINDDRCYTNWLTHHSAGYVVDAGRGSAARHVVLHRATCRAIKSAPRRRLTTGAHLKACSLDAQELVAWARQERRVEPQPCPDCLPKRDVRDPSSALSVGEASHGVQGRFRRTPLGGRIVDHILELAAMHIGGESPEYGVTVGQLASAFGKSLAQIRSPLMRLVQEGQIALADQAIQGTRLRAGTPVFPTAAALRSLPALAALSANDLNSELDRLRQA